ncbi:MAG TPA: triphosphoribosyl-dephospho-CoA synthase CitG [Desulfosporosinus sp.]|nr:triphosphoribosyl-dephospho-CoA synthase CitG [Desulfosporosinus sp.]
MVKNMNHKVKDHGINIGSLAVQAMLYEASCTPSPGLISRTSSGAHTDMDYFTFLDSATSLMNPLIHCTEAGFSSKSPQEIFQQLRVLGKLGEQQMLAKTSGVNTHKGMLFLLGVCCAAGGKALYQGIPFTSLSSMIKEMTSGVVERELVARLQEFKKADQAAMTHGERLFLEHNVVGIRGEVQRGLPTVFDFSLKFYKANKGLNKNHRLVQTLLAIMQGCEDTNILHRHSLETLQEVQQTAKQILSIGGVTTIKGMKAIEAMNEDLSKRKISPGGSADLLGVTVFLYLLEEYLGRVRETRPRPCDRRAKLGL